MKHSFLNSTLPIGLGCMSLPEDYRTVKFILGAASDAGIQVFDTADLYQNGKNEENLEKFFQGKRQQIKLISKVGNQLNPDGKSWTWNPKKDYLLSAVEKSLSRLHTDYLDLCLLHGGTLEDPWEETLEAFEILKSQGKILSFGISSIRPNVIRKVMEMNPPSAIMMQYSLLDRRPEETVFSLLEKTETKVLVRGALAKGMLIDKPVSSFLDYSAAEVQKVKDEIQGTGFSSESVLIKFALAPKAVGLAILGASTAEQVLANVKAYHESLQIPEDILIQLQSVVPANLYQDHR